MKNNETITMCKQQLCKLTFENFKPCTGKYVVKLALVLRVLLNRKLKVF